MSAQTIRRAAAVAAALAVTAAVPAAAQAPRPTVQTDGACYSLDDVVGLSGTGWTPGGTVSVTFSGRGIGMVETTADQAGNLLAGVRVTEEIVENFLGNNDLTREIALTAYDQTRGEQTNNAPESIATGSTRMSRFEVNWNQTDDAMEPGRRLAVEAVGYTGMAGRPLYLHYVRGGRRVATVRLGVIRGACGILRRTLPRAFPRSIARPGRWSLVFGTSRTQATPRNAMWIRKDVRIRN